MKIICIGQNYLKHIEELNSKIAALQEREAAALRREAESELYNRNRFFY